MFQTSSYNFPITDEYIAQHPAEKRDTSWLMVLDKEKKQREHKLFSDISNYINSGDLLVLNNTKVLPARLIGRKINEDNNAGALCELLLLQNLGNDQWEVLARPGRRIKIGTKIIFGQAELTAEIIGETDFGGRIVKFTYAGVFNETLDRLGFIPLPPYIKTKEHLHSNHHLAQRYQTVYASQLGAAAAPTAGLHFTPELLQKLKDQGVQTAEVTLHTGLGTFRPISAEDVRDHDIHQEWYHLNAETINKIKQTKQAGKRVIAVGTTAVRVLETCAKEILAGSAKDLEGFTNIYIYPGYEFLLTDALITNFHLPMSTLLVLVSAFAGKDFVLESYLDGLKRKYRFYSFGDAMFIY